jgi:hypothetical protein
MFLGSYDLEDSFGGIPEKVHTPVGLFFDAKLDYFSVLWYGIGEISGKVKISIQVGMFMVRYGFIYSSEGFPEKQKYRYKLECSWLDMDSYIPPKDFRKRFMLSLIFSSVEY